MMRSKLFGMMLMASAMGLTATSCSSDDDVYDSLNIICTCDVTSRAVYQGSKDMTYTFFREVNNNVKDSDNFMLSPLSLTEVMAMLANGANGETQKQILEVINAGSLNPDTVSNAINILNNYLPNADKESTVSIANSQWIDDELTVKDDYVKKNEKILSVETYNQDLATDKTMKDINSWCSKKTKGCINKMFDSKLSDDDRMILINALYFKGTWSCKFDKNSTSDEDFTNYDGTKTKVKMMNQTNDFYSFVGNEFDIVELSYGNHAFCMDVILPHEGESLNKCINSLNKETMDSMLIQLESREVFLSMPRMNLQYRRELNNDLIEMGMKDAFSSSADFSGIFGDRKSHDLKVGQITSLKVDESGTEAAAVTYAQYYDSCASPAIVFNMNRPFAFLIRDTHTGVVLFIGRMVKF